MFQFLAAQKLRVKGADTLKKGLKIQEEEKKEEIEKKNNDEENKGINKKHERELFIANQNYLFNISKFFTQKDVSLSSFYMNKCNEQFSSIELKDEDKITTLIDKDLKCCFYCSFPFVNRDTFSITKQNRKQITIKDRNDVLITFSLKDIYKYNHFIKYLTYPKTNDILIYKCKNCNNYSIFNFEKNISLNKESNNQKNKATNKQTINKNNQITNNSDTTNKSMKNEQNKKDKSNEKKKEENNETKKKNESQKRKTTPSNNNENKQSKNKKKKQSNNSGGGLADFLKKL
ncbi:hypothetical protein ABK040_005430 [Willaertia magna]